jgi:hypothetical protein
MRKRLIVEMDERLAELLKNTGQMIIVESFSKDYDSRGSDKWEVTAGGRTEYSGWSRDAALETYSKFLAYARGTKDHPAYRKPVRMTKNGEPYMEPESNRKA